MEPSSRDLTQLLQDWSGGDASAADQLMPLVYDELRRLARHYLHRERSDHTLQPTALVNEAYLKLVDQRRVTWQNRSHFYGIAAQVMRRILVDHARSHVAEKRGGAAVKLSLDDVGVPVEQRAAGLVALDDALRNLSEVFPRKGQIVELRFFGGLTVEETATTLGVSDKTVMREWESAKLWLYRELEGQSDAGEQSGPA